VQLVNQKDTPLRVNGTIGFAPGISSLSVLQFPKWKQIESKSIHSSITPAAVTVNNTMHNMASSTPQDSTMHSNNEDTTVESSANNKDTINPISEFVTTSYIIDSINEALEATMNSAATAAEEEGDATTTKSCKKQPQQQQTFFELQKRMPDGSTRKATDDEMSAADMKNKIEQAAQLVSKMTLEQKLEWAQKQRQHGNTLYQEQQYKQAIDVYLTCLVVRDTAKGSERQKMESDLQVLILPVMNNLAQCALQLGWYHKAELFCTLAVESVSEDSRGQAIAKLYFKRGKARRLRGYYEESKLDLERAMEKLGIRMEEEDAKRKNDNTDKSAEQKAIERELQLLARAVVEGEKNKRRTEKAMKKILGSSQASASQEEERERPTTKQQSASDKNCSSNEEDVPLYPEKQGRTHSTVRARPGGPPPYPKLTLPVELSYWQMYRLIASRVAQRILDIIGEDEGTGFGASPSAEAGDEGNTNDRPKQE